MAQQAEEREKKKQQQAEEDAKYKDYIEQAKKHN